MKPWLIVLLWTALVTLLTHAAKVVAMPPYQARYAVSVSGLPVGEAVMRLENTGPEGYRMTSEVRPNGLVAALAGGSIQEQASGVVQAGQIQPLHYTRRLEAGRRSERVELRFDWTAGQVKAQANSRQAVLALTPGIADPLSLQLQVRQDMQRGQLRASYHLVDQTAIKSYRVRNLGQETLNTPLGRLVTTRLEQFEPGKTRKTTFWLAATLNQLPVRITQEKKGAEVLRLEIRTLDRSP